MATGAPLPMSAEFVIAKPSDAGPFPCQSHNCGCASAEKCWKACCCFTLEEKLAWARRAGVTPPSYVIAEAEQRPTVSRSPQRSCCSAKSATGNPAGKKSCCSSATTTTSKSCCAAASQPAAAETKLVWIAQIAAERCRGGSSATHWLNVPISLTGPATIAASSPLDAAPTLVVVVASSLSSASLVPPDPPPRIV